MTDIDQQMIFDRLPISAEQRKKLYDLLNEEQRVARCLACNSTAPDSPAPLGLSQPENSSLILKKQ